MEHNNYIVWAAGKGIETAIVVSAPSSYDARIKLAHMLATSVFSVMARKVEAT